MSGHGSLPRQPSFQSPFLAHHPINVDRAHLMSLAAGVGLVVLATGSIIWLGVDAAARNVVDFARILVRTIPIS